MREHRERQTRVIKGVAELLLTTMVRRRVKTILTERPELNGAAGMAAMDERLLATSVRVAGDFYRLVVGHAMTLPDVGGPTSNVTL